MPSNTEVTLHFTGRMRLGHPAHDHWLRFFLYAGPEDKQMKYTIRDGAGLPGNSSDWDAVFEARTADNGELRVMLREEQCQSNAVTADTLCARQD